MTVIVKDRRFQIDGVLAGLMLMAAAIVMFWYQAIEFVCTHNILRGQW